MDPTPAKATPSSPDFRPRVRPALAREDGIRDRVRRLTVQQQSFERAIAKRLRLDAPGLEAMEYLMSAGSSTPTELAAHLGISTAATTLVLNRLEGAGHVRRDRHPTDGRKLVVTARKQSEAAVRSCIEPLIDGVERLVQALTEEERTTVAAFLGKLIETYDEATPDHGGQRELR